MVLKEMDEDENGTIDFQQFLLYMLEKVNKQSLYDDIVQIFKVLDKENTGHITKNQISIYTEGLIEGQDINTFWQEADFQE